jgi:hypothetical protein
MIRGVGRFLLRLFQVFPEPVSHQTIGQRFVRALLFWGIPLILWDCLSYHAFRAPIEWGVIVVLLVLPTLAGAFVFAATEHGIYKARRRSGR